MASTKRSLTSKMAAGGVFCLLLLLCLFHISPVEGACRFPRNISRDENRWRFLSPDYSVAAQTPHTWRKVTLEEERLHVDYVLEDGKETEGKRLTYHCMGVEDKDKYILMWKSGKGVKFVCLKFLLRGPDVVQWKVSKAGPRLPGMCTDKNLHLMDSPMVYYNEMGGIDLSEGHTEIPKCPFSGGYVIRQWYTENGDPGCEEDGIPPLKIENACEEGEGLYFLGGSDTCPSPHEKVLLGRQYQCLASWVDGTFTYMMMDQSQPNGLIPCIRYPTDHRNRFTMHLFLDGVCDSTNTIDNSRVYRQMAMAMFPAIGICSDDTPACEVKDTSHCQFKMATSCRHSCQSCPADAAWLDLTFPEEFHGVWMKDSNHLGRENVTIDRQHIHIPSLGTYRTMGESDCSRKQPDQAPYGMTKEAKEYSLVQTFHNGCSHRMTLLQIVNRSDSVLSFRVSKPGVVSWNLAVNEANMKWQIMGGWEKWCTKVMYPLPQPNPQDSARTDLTGWFNMVDEHADTETVNCTLPDKILEEFRMELPTGQQCNGAIDQTVPNGIQLRYKDCKSSGVLESGSHAIEQLAKFECLASFVGESGRTFLITHTPKEFPNAVNETHLCWVFSTGQDIGTVFWFRVSDCDSNSDVYAQRGFRKELAKFDFHFVPPPAKEINVGAGARPRTWCPLVVLCVTIVISAISILVTTA